MDTFSSLMYGFLTNDYETADKCGRDTINGYTVDTCDTNDAGYETAIWYKDNPMVIVERYPDADTATLGHSKWCEFVKGAPTEVWSVQTDRMEKLV